MEKINNIILKYLPFLLVLTAILFNIFTLAPELNIKSEPNDNSFQLGLITRMNEVFKEVTSGKIPALSLIDHWVPYWASGYPLPFYYQHLPQLMIVVLYNLLGKSIELSSLFNFVKFAFWFLLPVSFYFSGLKFGFTKMACAFTALFSSLIITDGLFGIDISSFAWRGYGLSTQLFGVFFAPLALSQIYQTINQYTFKKFLLACLLLFLTFSSHLAIGYVVAVSALLIPFCFIDFEKIENFKLKIFDLSRLYLRLFTIFISCFMLLSYWFIPLFLNNTYHNISFWDPVAKWNSYGYKEIIPLFLNGALFDFGRTPILTGLVIAGLFISLYKFKGKERFFVLMFCLWLALYFGRTTWGNIIDLIPMMKEMHIERFINGVQLAGIFLAGLSASLLFSKKQFLVLSFGFLIIVIKITVAPNINYLKFNNEWISQSNKSYEVSVNDYQKMIDKIKSLPPGRVYAGRPGNWGRDFKIGSTQLYLALSTSGLDLTGFLPESWSLNSDPEALFNEEKYQDYNLLNVRYLITPKEKIIPSFAKDIQEFGNFNLSEVKTNGYFDLGTSNLLVTAKKENILNVIHLWQGSEISNNQEFPTLLLDNNPLDLTYVNKISLDNTNTYLENGTTNSLFNLKYPVYARPKDLGRITEEKISNEKYEAKYTINDQCLNCLLVFKMTYHPNWQVYIDNKKVNKFMVFPSYMAVKAEPGDHSIRYEYQPSIIKIPLIILGILSPLLYFVSKRRFTREA